MNRRDLRKAGSKPAKSHFDETSAVTPVALLEAVNCPAVVVDSLGTVLERNAPVEHLLGPDLYLRNGRIEAADRLSGGLLRRVIQAACTAAPRGYMALPPIPLRRRDQRPLIVQALALSELSRPGQAILLIWDLEASPTLPTGRLGLIFGLTRAEAKLAAQIAAGASLQDAATALGVSVGTARNQLKAVFAKTGAKRQAELVALLWRVARMAPERLA